MTIGDFHIAAISRSNFLGIFEALLADVRSLVGGAGNLPHIGRSLGLACLAGLGGGTLGIGICA